MGYIYYQQEPKHRDGKNTERNDTICSFIDSPHQRLYSLFPSQCKMLISKSKGNADGRSRRPFNRDHIA